VTLQLGSHGPLVSRWTDVMLKRFRSYALGVNGLPIKNDGYYGYDEEKVQKEYERRTNQPQDGVVSDRDLGALGLAQPVIFSVEGHMSNMWFGPAADTAHQVQIEGLAYWQPFGYVNNDIPFHNKQPVADLVAMIGSTSLPDGTPFPPGTNWGIESFSRGAMIATMLMRDHVLPENGALHWRLKDFRRGLAHGNPFRGKDACCPWAADPPGKGTGGIMLDERFDTKGTAIEGLWQEHPRKGDMFSDNGEDDVAKDKAAIAKIVTENSWAGGDAALLSRFIKIMGNPGTQGIAVIIAIIGAIKFAVANPNPHYSTVSQPGDVAWMRGVAA
jgi:hypothetical protein